MSFAKPSILAAVAGVTSCTVFFTMNTTLNYIALPSYMLPPHLKSSQEETQGDESNSTTNPEAPTDLILRQWEQTYSRGHQVAPGSCVLSTLSFLYAAYTLPTNEAAVWSNLKGWYYLAATFAVLAVPFTVLFILPTNDELYRRAAAARNNQAKTQTEAEGHKQEAGKSESLQTSVYAGSKQLNHRLRIQDVDTLTLIRNCLFLSRIRAVMPLPAILIGLWIIGRTTDRLTLRN